MAGRVVVGGRGGAAPIPGYDIGKLYLGVMEAAFQTADVDHSGSLNSLELMKMWRIMFSSLSSKQVWKCTDDIHQDLDPNRDGQVSWPELEKFFTGQASPFTEVDRLIAQNVIDDRLPSVKDVGWMVVEIDSPSYLEGTPPWVPCVKRMVSFTSNVAIIISILNFVIESMPSKQVPDGVEDRTGAAFIAEAVCIAIFTVEFIARTACCPSRGDYWSSFYTWVDVLAILPFYIGVSLGSNPSGGLVVLRVLRLLRLIRMLKLGRSFEAVQVLIIAIQRTIKPLLVAMLGINCIAVILFASLIFTVEREDANFDFTLQKWVRKNESDYEDAGKVISFQSIPESMWWAWVTLTTVGYGDMYPVTGGGKTIASFTMVCGLVVMSFPLTLLASSFAETMGELRQKKQAQKRGAQFMHDLEVHALKSADDIYRAHGRPVDAPSSDLKSSQEASQSGEFGGGRRGRRGSQSGEWAATSAPRTDANLAGSDVMIGVGPDGENVPSNPLVRSSQEHFLPPSREGARAGGGGGAAADRGGAAAGSPSLAGQVAQQKEALVQLSQNVAQIANAMRDLTTAVISPRRPLPPGKGWGGAAAPPAAVPASAASGGARSPPALDARPASHSAWEPPAPRRTIEPGDDIARTVSCILSGATSLDGPAQIPRPDPLPSDGAITIAYVSAQAQDLRPEGVAGIVASSRKSNAKAGISGVLVDAPPLFLHILEGPDAAVRALVDRIRQDSRHGGMEVVTDRPVGKHRLTASAMASAVVRPATRAELLQAAATLLIRGDDQQAGLSASG